jgi:hypothetical protein
MTSPDTDRTLLPVAYEIATIQDLLRVPVERLGDCLRDIETGLMLHHLAFGETAAEVAINAMTWIDDGDRSVKLRAGEEEFTLKVETA